MQTLPCVEEYKSLQAKRVSFEYSTDPGSNRRSIPPDRFSYPSSIQHMWKAPELDYLKINIDVAFSENKIGIGRFETIWVYLFLQGPYHIWDASQ